MSGSLNKVMLIGNLGRDPETRSTAGGQKIVNLNVATSESWKGRDGERQERTEWHRVVIFDEKIGEIAERYLRKGSTVYLEGALQTRKWTDQSGQERYTTEVVLQRFGGKLTLLGGRGDDSGERSMQSSYAPLQQRQEPRQQARGKTQDFDELDDEIPF